MSTKTWALGFAALLCGLFFCAGEGQVTADPVPNCQTWCKSVYAWWDKGNPGTQSTSAEKTGTKGATHDHNALNPIYANVSIEIPPLKPAGNFDRFIWTSNSASCAKIGGVWPSPQEVTPGGTGAFDANVNQVICTVPPPP